MQIASRYLKDAKVLTLKGWFDYHAKSEFDLAITCAEEIRCHHIILNLGEMSGIDSAGLGRIILCMQKLRNQGIRMTILNPAPHIRELLELFGFSSSLPICHSEEEALTLAS